MKIHRFSPWLRRRSEWTRLAIRTIDAVFVPVVLICLLVYGLDDLKAWLG